MSEVSSRLRWKVLLAVSSLALVAAATILPITLANAAPQKIYDLTIAPTTLQAGTTNQTLTATFKNATPSGVSSINSLKLFVQAPPGFLITDATGVGTENVQLPGRQSVFVSNIPSVKPGKTYVLTLKVTTPAATDCAGTNVTWTADVRAGNSFTGDTFALHDGVGTTTHIGVTCGLTFTQQPSDALKDAVITPAITVTGSPANLFSGDEINLAIAGDSPTTATPGGDTSKNANPSGVATFNDITLPASGNYKLVATSGDATTDSSDTFTISDGNINCGQTVSTDNDGDETQTVDATQLNVPGCSLKPYILTHAGESVEFLYPTGQAASAFTIDVHAFAPEPVPSGPVPMTTVDVKFDANGDLIPFPHPIQWCLTAANGDTVLPGTEATCLLSQSTVTLATNQIQVSETYYLEGDMKWSRA